MIIHDTVQGSAEWLKARLGVVTASEFGALVTPLFKQRTGEGVQAYLYRKVCERVLGYAPDTGGSFAMSNGSIIEHEAVPWLAFAHNLKIDRVGFVTTDDGKAGCSPDGLIGAEGGLEVKSPTEPIHLRYLMDNEVPGEYLPQIHFSMYVTGRKWWKFLSYNRQFPAVVIHVERDEQIQQAIHLALTDFLKQLDYAHAKIKALKDAEMAPPQQILNDR